MIDSIQIPSAEGPQIEFKPEWTETAKECFCAFLNTSGGKVFFGVDNEGQVVGIDNPDLVERSILSVFRFAIHPQSIDLCKVTRETVNGRTVVVADVLEGRHPPYFVTVSKESGKERLCYMRRGSSNYAVNDDELKALYRKSDATPYELRASPEQKLTFETLAKYFEAAGIEFSEQKYQILGMTTNSGFFTNLALWVSDQSTIETRVGFFSGTDKGSNAGGILTFQGCIVDQYNRIRKLLNNRFGFSYEIGAFDLRRDGTRNEVKDYPEAAIREALVNLFVHRDFSIPAASTITCFSDRIELLSFGGVLPEADPELLKLGASMPRNPRLAEMLLRLSAMEKYGIGIPLMYSSYKPYGLEPKLIEYPRALMIVLPRITLHPENLSETERHIVDFLRNKGASKRAEIQNSLQRSYGFTVNALQSMLEKGIVMKEGGGRNTRYRLR